MTTKDISIVICTKNSERVLEKVLESCLENNPLEIIIVDHNSTDGTLDLAKRFGVKVLTEDRGLGYARQMGAKEARGEFVAYVDSDIILPPNTMQTLVKEMIENEYVGISAKVISLTNNTYWEWAEGQAIGLEYNNEGDADLIGTLATAYRKEVVLSFGFDPFFVGAGEDIDFAYRLRKAGNRLGVSSATVYHDYPATLRGLMKKRYWWGKGDARFFWRHRDLRAFILPFFVIPHAFFRCLKEKSFKMFPYYVFRSISNILGRVIEFLNLTLSQRRSRRSSILLPSPG